MKPFQSLIRCFSIFLLVFSCNQQQLENVQNANRLGGTLKISCLGSLETLDPQKIMFGTDWKVASLVYEGLIDFNSDSSGLEKHLCVSWQKLDQGKRYLFEIRDDVYFHDDPCFPDGKGRKLNAWDIYYTFQRMATRETQCPNFYLFSGRIQGIDDFNQGKTEMITGITVLDSTHIQFDLNKSYSSFLKTLTTPAAYIVAKEAVDYYGPKINQHPVGTGPFRLNKWKQLEYLTLIKHDKYWGRDEQGVELPYLDAVQINLISNPVIRFSEFLNGNIHLIETGEKLFSKLKDETDFDSKYQVAGKFQDLTVRFFGIRMDNDSPLSKEPKLRQAVAYSFNRAAINKEAYSHKENANTFVPLILLQDSTSRWYEYNPGYAKKLASQIDLDVFHKPVIISSNLATREAEFMKAGLDDLGIPNKIKIKQVRYFTGLKTDRPDIFRISVHPNYPEPEEYYFLFYSKNTFMHAINGYKNTRYDLLFEQSVVEQDDGKRKKIYLDLEKILKQDVPAIYLSNFSYSYTIVPLFVNGVKGRLSSLDFRQVWLNTSHESFK